MCVLYYSKNTVLTPLHWSLQQPFLTGCAVCNTKQSLFSRAGCAPHCWLCPRSLSKCRGGRGGGRGVSAPHPDSCTCVDAFICPLRQHILRELVQLPHALRRLDIIAYFDCHVIHGRAVQRTFCSESLSTPEQITRQAYARTTWLKRSASTTPNKQKSIMIVLIC